MEAFLHDLSWVLPLRSQVATVVFLAFTSLGYTRFFLLFLSLGYWVGDKRVFTRLAMLVLATAILNSFLKDFFQDPRPGFTYAIDGRVGDSYGLPSGHAQVAVVLWFWLAYEIRRLWAYGVASILVGGIVFSRLYLGVHDVEDVLAGALFGTGCIFLYRALLSSRFDSWRSLNPFFQVGIIAAAQFAAYAAWPGGDPYTGALSTCGFMTGWFASAAVERRYVRHEKSSSIWRVALSGLLGTGCLLLLLVFEKPHASATVSGSDFIAYLKGFTLGVVIVALMPFVFSILRLGTRTENDSRAKPDGKRA
jgi:membrane-associated phospholipid phosphatase